jgi:DNA-directed RNA polymerase specialized sigma24 family protein
MPPVLNVPWIDASAETELLAGARHGDAASFRGLIDAHRRQHYALCFAMCGRPDEAAHVMIESSRLAWRGLKLLPAEKPFFPYLARIVRNVVVVQRRRNAGVPHELPERRPSGIPWGAGAEDARLAAEEKGLLLAFHALAVDEQLLLSLRTSLRLSYPEIGLVLDLPPGTVMHRLQSLRARIEGAPPAAAAA